MKRLRNALAIERLESRFALAGNITATMVGNDLHINGDDFDNTLIVEQNQSNEVILRGLSPVSSGPIDQLIVSDYFSAMRRVDPETGAVLGALTGGDQAGEIDLGPDGLIYAAYFESSAIRKIDPVSGQQVGTIPLPGKPRDVTFGPDGELYIALTGDHSGRGPIGIFRYDVGAQQLSPRFNTTVLNGTPIGIAFGPADDLWVALDARYAGNGAHSIVRIDGETGDFEGVFATEGVNIPQSLAFGPNGVLYVGNQGSGTITHYATDGSYLGVLVSAAGNAQGLYFLPDGDLVWGRGGDSFARFDFSSNSASVFSSGYSFSHSLVGISTGQPQSTIDTTGMPLNPVVFQNVTGSIFINLRGGNDRLTIANGRFEGAVHADLGTGQDHIEVGGNGPVSMRGSFLVHLSDGEDHFIQTRTTVGGYETIHGDAGNDRITIGSSSVADGLLVDGSIGFDAIRVEKTAIGAFAGFLGGEQADRIELIYSVFAQGVSILGGADADLFDLNGCRFDATLYVALETGFGVATIQGCIVASNAYLTANGESYLRFAASIAPRLEIVSGASNDAVTIEGSVLEELFGSLGDGDDQLRVLASRIERGGLFDGQQGRDSLLDSGNIISGVQWLGFETVNGSLEQSQPKVLRPLN